MSNTILEHLKNGLIASSQVMNPASPLKDPSILSKLALAAELGGAVGFRVDGTDVVAKLRSLSSQPIIGIKKKRIPDIDTYITVSISDALALADAGADVIAVQATAGSRPAESFSEIALAVHAQGKLVMADISTLDEGIAAAAHGADIIATTLSGYTPQSRNAHRPDVALAGLLTQRIDIPIIVEGGIWTPEDVMRAIDAGAWSVVVGSALTAPDLIAKRLTQGLPQRKLVR